jgi:hypothetical protein
MNDAEAVGPGEAGQGVDNGAVQPPRALAAPEGQQAEGRTAVGLALLGIGVASTIPIAMRVLGSK